MKTVVKVMVAALGVAIGFADSLVAEDAPLKMLFLGNSITWHEYNTSVGWLQEWGMAASEESKDYVHQMAADVERITGVAPTLRVRNIYPLEKIITTADIDGDADIAADVAFKPDVVVIAIGENFQGPSAADAATFKEQIKKLAGKFTATTPLNKILIRSPFWQNTTQATLMKAAADELGVLFVDAGPLGSVAANKATGLFPHAGVANHPGDKGMRAIADLMMTALFPDEFSPEIPSGGEEDPGTTPEAPVVTEVGEYAAVDGEGTVITRAPCIGGNTIRQLSNGEYVHVFTSDGTFYVNDLDANTEIQYLIVGGGGSGGSLMAGGGGGGGVRVGTFRMAKGALATIRVGKGGVFSGAPGEGGTSGTISDIWQDGYQINGAEGGGGGAGWNDGASDNHPAKIGASSGGQCHGRTSAVTATDGHRGGIAAGNVPGGGGGAGAPGADGAAGQAGAGGAGVLCCITGKAAYYGAGGGGGANWSGAQNFGSFAAGAGGSGVGGNGGATGFGGGDAVANTGSGGGGASSSGSSDNADPGWFGGSGADGIVVLRYAYSGEITDPQLPQFDHQALLTVSGYEGEETLKDFPLLVRVSPEKIEGFVYAGCQPNGADIVFATMGGEVLPSEVDTWNPAGESLFWVRVPQLAGRDTQLKMMWGADKPVVNNGRDSAALWKDYAGVYHFSEQFGTAADSSSAANDAPLTSASYQYTAVGVDGKVGLSRHVIGVANGSSLKMMNAPAITDHNNFTVSCWYKFISSAATADYGVLWAKPGTAWNVNDGWFMSLRANDGYPYICGQGTVQHHAKVNAKSGWHYLTMVVDSGSLRAGCDGEMTGVAASGQLSIQSSSPAYIGYCATCEIDELRIRKDSNVSADYVAAEYAQMTKGDFVVAEMVSEDNPELGQLSVKELGRGKARITLEVLSLGEGAEWADIKVACIPAGSEAAEYETLGRVTAVGPTAVVVAGLESGMTYEVRIRVENSLGRSLTVSKSLSTRPDLGKIGFDRYSILTPTAKSWQETLTNFPLMVRVSAARISGFNYDDCRADGKDVMFVSLAGEFLPSEIDTWNPSGESIFWVKVPRFSSTTSICLVWGRKTKPVIDSHPTEVWSDYVGVWHLNEASGDALDSAGNGHDAVLDNNYTATCVGTGDGEIGKARQIPQITTLANGIACSPLSASGCTVTDTANFAVQAWYKYRSWTNKECDPGILYAKNPASGKWNDNVGWFFSGRANASTAESRKVYFNSMGSTQTEWNTYLESEAWGGYIATVEEGAVRLFKNGQLVLTKAGQESAAVTLTNPTYSMLFGANVTCDMDEVRIRNKPVSAAWAKQEYAAMTGSGYLTFSPAAKTPKNGLVLVFKGIK